MAAPFLDWTHHGSTSYHPPEVRDQIEGSSKAAGEHASPGPSKVTNDRSGSAAEIEKKSVSKGGIPDEQLAARKLSAIAAIKTLRMKEELHMELIFNVKKIKTWYNQTSSAAIVRNLITEAEKQAEILDVVSNPRDPVIHEKFTDTLNKIFVIWAMLPPTGPRNLPINVVSLADKLDNRNTIGKIWWISVMTDFEYFLKTGNSRTGWFEYCDATTVNSPSSTRTIGQPAAVKHTIIIDDDEEPVCETIKEELEDETLDRPRKHDVSSLGQLTSNSAMIDPHADAPDVEVKGLLKPPRNVSGILDDGSLLEGRKRTAETDDHLFPRHTLKKPKARMSHSETQAQTPPSISADLDHKSDQSGVSRNAANIEEPVAPKIFTYVSTPASMSRAQYAAYREDVRNRALSSERTGQPLEPLESGVLHALLDLDQDNRLEIKKRDQVINSMGMKIFDL